MKRSDMDYIDNHWQGIIGEEKPWEGGGSVSNFM
jgi:hypothetical protein